jgi:hypothetical protein
MSAFVFAVCLFTFAELEKRLANGKRALTVSEEIIES